MGVGVGEGMNAVDGMNKAVLAASVARQVAMARRLNVACQHLVAWRKKSAAGPSDTGWYARRRARSLATPAKVGPGLSPAARPAGRALLARQLTLRRARPLNQAYLERPAAPGGGIAAELLRALPVGGYGLFGSGVVPPPGVLLKWPTLPMPALALTSPAAAVAPLTSLLPATKFLTAVRSVAPPA